MVMWTEEAVRGNMGLGSGLAPSSPPGQPQRPVGLAGEMWPRTLALAAEARSYYWRGVGSRASCALPSLSQLRQPRGLKSTGRSYLRGASSVWTQQLPAPPPPPGEWPAGQTGETLGRVRRRPWPRTESQETPSPTPRLEGVCDRKPPSAQRPCSPGWDTGRGGPPGGCPRAGKARVRDPETRLEPSAWAEVATPPPSKPGGSASQREWGWAPAGLRLLAVHFHAPRVPPLPPRSLSFSL